MKSFQLRTWNYEGVIEWIPFGRLSVVEQVGIGGFGSVYKATWLDGPSSQWRRGVVRPCLSLPVNSVKYK
ncbi:kinase-like protein [Gigaspora margarita]|uniref:Kinase-like protein n=1 Tax=Gigaspora margarita TaxID=4874 RepID=A0A8H4EVH7_GIGMA|nr:kinase-like protein [Gigaspora margarita]